jgi:hypothetical protein
VPPRTGIAEEDLEAAAAARRERERRAEMLGDEARRVEAHEAHDALEDVAMETVRRLDAAAEEVRGRRAAREAAVRRLEEIARERAGMVGAVEEEAGAVSAAARERVEAGKRALEGQVGRLEGLAKRMRESERRAERVSGRLESAGEKVEDFESMEAEVQASISCEFGGRRRRILTRGSPVPDRVGGSCGTARRAVCAAGVQHLQRAGGPGGHSGALGGGREAL